MSSEEMVPNERLRRARNLKGWSQAELAEKVGTSFEMVSRWERGITVPSPHYRRRLCSVLSQTLEELGLARDLKNSFTLPSSPFVLLASANVDAEKAIVSHLKTVLKERGITFWSSRQIGKQRNGNTQATLWEVVQAAHAILIVISPQSRSSRHVREALEMGCRYQRPMCGIWIEGEHWEECLPEERVELTALIDARERDISSTLEETVNTLERVRLATQNGTEVSQPSLTGIQMEAPVNQPTEIHVSSEQPAELLTQQSHVAEGLPPPLYSLEPTNTAKPMLTDLPQLATPPISSNRMGLSRIRLARQQQKIARSTAGFLIGLVVLLIGGALLGSTLLLSHLRTTAAIVSPIRGGIWTYGIGGNVHSLIPNGTNDEAPTVMDQALYLPLFFGDAQGVIHAGAATTVPTIQNGGVNADATIWTLHLRPHLIWSDGKPYDARDVDFTWKLWLNPKFGATNTQGYNLIRSADVSADHLSITFHLKQPFAPFLSYWVDGLFAPLPAHYFSSMAPEQILKSPDNLNPKVTSGPFMMSESVPGDHYTMVRNPKYYLAREGLPYLDKVVFNFVNSADLGLKGLQAGSLDATGLITDIQHFQSMQRLKYYTLIYPPTQNTFEALYFNFHNTVLASHPEVRQAMAIAVDQQSIIAGALKGLGTPLCTDHPSAYHPGFDPIPPCPVFNLAAASKLLDDNGWVRGPDGIRSKGRQRLEFEYSTSVTTRDERTDVETIIQRDFEQIGIKLDIQNYTFDTFFGSLLPQGKASPPTGAVAGRYDIAEFTDYLAYDPDDSGLFACNQFPSAANNFNGLNLDFYCNPALDKLFAQEQATADPGVRQQIFIQIHQIYLTQYPFIVLYGPTWYALARKGTHNYLPGPYTDTYNIAQWWCDNGKC